MTSFVADLRAAVGDGRVVDDPAVLDAYRSDQTAWIVGGKPAALVRPRSTEEVAASLRVAARHGVPVVPRGAGSGLSGGAAAIDGCLVLSTERLDRIVDVDPVDQVAVVQAGAVNDAVKAAAREHGLWYPPDPASADFCTIGGNVATNAGGLCCVKYGTTRQWVLGLEAVLADGTALRLGGRTRKRSAGYDLAGLLVGSEGTLAVITEVTLRLTPLAPPPATLVAFFPTLAGAGAAVAAISRSVVPSMLEIMDRTTVRAVERFARMDLDTDAAALLLVQVDAPTVEARREQLAVVEKAADGASLVVASDDPDEGVELVRARKLAYPALERLGRTLLDDVVVPRSRLIELVAGCERIAERTGTTVATFGHAGDGNLHPTFVWDHAAGADEAERNRTAFDEVVALGVALGGAVSGEHGVGLLKRAHLHAHLTPDHERLQREIKRLFDPDELLNPGKLLAR